MEKYVLSNEEKQDVVDLLSLDAKIYYLMQKLAKLEAKFKKNSKKYSFILEKVQVLLVMEETLYKKIGTDPAKISEIISFLGDPSELTNFGTILNAVFLENNCYKISAYRIVNNLVKIDLINNADIINKNIKSLFKNPNTFLPVSIPTNLLMHIDLSTKYDIVNSILYFNNQDALQTNSQKEYTHLTKFKYRLAFFFSDIEKELISNNFEVGDDLYLTAETYKFDERIGETAFNEKRQDFIRLLINSSSNALHKIKQNNLDTIILKNIFKVGVMLLPKTLTNKLHDEFLKRIRMDSKENPSIKIDLELFRIIMHNENYKKIPKIVTIRFRKYDNKN